MRKLVTPALVLLLVPTAVFAAKSKPQTVSGEAIIRSIGDNRVAVLLDTNDDQAIDQGFLLSSDLPVSSTTASCPGASIEFTASYVRVTYDKKVIDLYVAGYPEPPAAPQQHDSTKFIGYALMHSTGTSGCNVERALTDAGACYNYGKD
jgi:hypothetical protein